MDEALVYGNEKGKFVVAEESARAMAGSESESVCICLCRCEYE